MSVCVCVRARVRVRVSARGINTGTYARAQSLSPLLSHSLARSLSPPPSLARCTEREPAIARAAIGAAGEGDDAVVLRKSGVGRRRHEAREYRAQTVKKDATLDAGIKLSVLWTRDTSAVATMSPTVSTDVMT